MVNRKGVSLKGRVIYGLGRGKYYLSLKEYNEPIQKLLGSDPYLGTLNIKIHSGKIAIGDLRELTPFMIHPRKAESADDENPGYVQCYPARVNGSDCLAVLPERSIHEGVMEIISGNCLRDIFGLEDDDEVSVEVFSFEEKNFLEEPDRNTIM